MRQHPTWLSGWDEFSDAPPFCLELPLGICPAAMPRAPRLPVLGLRGLRFANLELLIDGHPSRPFSLRTLPPNLTAFDDARGEIVRRTARHPYSKPAVQAETEVCKEREVEEFAFV